ncbi:MAG TPA: helix-turn-helix transcriptional regulator, partial [Thermoanaerobaculaceae bacterium]|nr:helix-turn-helix transcriptional regulator [Thermoanaerobaculaceae bacterium]
MSRPVPTDHPQRVRKLRGRLGLTQAQLAEKLGVSFASVNRWENAHSTPTRLAWQKLEAVERFGLAALETDPAGGEVTTGDVAPGGARGEMLPLDFTGDPEGVRAVVEAHWLAEGYQTNPA